MSVCDCCGEEISLEDYSGLGISYGIKQFPEIKITTCTPCFIDSKCDERIYEIAKERQLAEDD